MLHQKVTEEIIGSAMAVLNELRPGLDEKLYENALVIELLARGHFIGKLIPDLLVDGQVIVDPKVVVQFNDAHVAQMLGYLSITGFAVALLLSFKEPKLKWKRVVRSNGSAAVATMP